MVLQPTPTAIARASAHPTTGTEAAEPPKADAAPKERAAATPLSGLGNGNLGHSLPRIRTVVA